MITYLPRFGYAASAWVLDSRRLDIQRRDTLEIMTSLLTGTGRVSHPSVLMWRRYEWALLQYQHAMCEEWTVRGHKDTFWERTQTLYERYQTRVESRVWPYWSDSERLHMSHQSALLKEDYTYYIQCFPSAPLDMETIYPEPYSDHRKLDNKPWWEPPLDF
jgi:hypothetical protein